MVPFTMNLPKLLSTIVTFFLLLSIGSSVDLRRHHRRSTTILEDSQSAVTEAKSGEEAKDMAWFRQGGGETSSHQKSHNPLPHGGLAHQEATSSHLPSVGGTEHDEPEPKDLYPVALEQLNLGLPIPTSKPKHRTFKPQPKHKPVAPELEPKPAIPKPERNFMEVSETEPDALPARNGDLKVTDTSGSPAKNSQAATWNSRMKDRFQILLSKIKASLIRTSQNVQQKLFNAQLWLISFKDRILSPKSPAEELNISPAEQLNIMKYQSETLGDVLGNQPKWQDPSFPSELYSNNAKASEACQVLGKEMTPRSLAEYLTPKVSDTSLEKSLSKPAEVYMAQFESYFSKLGKLKASELPIEHLIDHWNHLASLDLKSPGLLPEQETDVAKRVEDFLRSTETEDFKFSYYAETTYFRKNALPSDRSHLRVPYIPPDPLDQNPVELEMELHRFMRVRVRQTVEPKSVIIGPPTPESTLARMPPGMPVMVQFLRFRIAKRFEKILRDIENGLLSKLLSGFSKQITASKLDTPKVLTDQVNSLFSSAATEDVLWRERFFSQYYGLTESPSQIYERLCEASDEALEALRADVNENAKLIRKALGSTRLHIMRTSHNMRLIREILGRAQEDGLIPLGTNEAEMIAKLEAKANPKVDEKLVERLYKKGAISKRFRKKLLDAKTQADVEVEIGSEQAFKEALTENLHKKLLNMIGDDVTNDAVWSRAARKLAQSYVNELDAQARNSYLTRDGFFDSRKFRFKDALKVFDQSNINEILKDPVDRNLAKSYLEARLLDKVVSDRGQIHEFCSQLKLKLDPAAKKLINLDGVVNLMKDWDDRLMAFYHKPLKLDQDGRLKGTSFESLGVVERKQINRLVKLVYENRQRLDSSLEQAQQLRPEIEEFEQNVISPIAGRYIKAMAPLVYALRQSITKPVVEPQAGARLPSAG